MEVDATQQSPDRLAQTIAKAAQLIPAYADGAQTGKAAPPSPPTAAGPYTRHPAWDGRVIGGQASEGASAGAASSGQAEQYGPRRPRSRSPTRAKAPPEVKPADDYCHITGAVEQSVSANAPASENA